MQKYYTTKEDKDGDYVTVNHTRYTVTEIDPARVHIPAGREADIDLYDSQAEFLESMGLSPVEGHVFPEPEPFPAVAPVVPDVVDMWKLKAVLDIVGKTAMIETVIAGICDKALSMLRAGGCLLVHDAHYPSVAKYLAQHDHELIPNTRYAKILHN